MSSKRSHGHNHLVNFLTSDNISAVLSTIGSLEVALSDTSPWPPPHYKLNVLPCNPHLLLVLQTTVCLMLLTGFYVDASPVILLSHAYLINSSRFIKGILIL